MSPSRLYLSLGLCALCSIRSSNFDELGEHSHQCTEIQCEYYENQRCKYVILYGLFRASCIPLTLLFINITCIFIVTTININKDVKHTIAFIHLKQDLKLLHGKWVIHSKILITSDRVTNFYCAFPFFNDCQLPLGIINHVQI